MRRCLSAKKSPQKRSSNGAVKGLAATADRTQYKYD